jgi:putative ABC transport system permease protein
MTFLVRFLLFLYPRAFRLEYGDRIVSLIRRRVREAGRQRGRRAAARVWMHNVSDLAGGAWHEHRLERRGRPSTQHASGDNMMVTLLQDIRYSLRMMRRRPGFTAAVLLTLTLGIGTSTTVFSVADTLMFRELPYPDAHKVVTIWRTNLADGIPREDVSPADFIDWRERAESFETIAAADPYSMDLTSDGPPETLYAVLVTDGFFDVLGIQPRLGRLFRSDDYRAEAGNVVVLTHGLWQRRFGLAPDIVGRTLTLDGTPRVVIGVLPEEFDLGLLPAAGERGVWAPRPWEGWEQNTRGSAWWNVIARVKENVSVEQAQDEMDRVSAALASEYPTTNENTGATVVPLRDHLVGAARPALLMLLGAVGLVLLIACANVANLLLARGADRESEFVIRAALGAERGRLVRQLLVESLVLALLGAGLGFAFSFWGLAFVKGMTPGDIPRIDEVAVDLRVLASALSISVLAAVVFGLVPATQFSRPRIRDALSEGRSTEGNRRQRLRATLIVVEMALAVALLVGAGLLLRSFSTLLQVDPGFQRENLLAFQVFAYHDDDDTAIHRINFFSETIERIEALPMVESVGAVSAAPFLEADLAIRRAFTIEDLPVPSPGQEPQAYVAYATEGYFHTVSIPLLAGRLFTSFDRIGSPPVALVNETLQRRYWPNGDVPGKMVRVGDSNPIEIVGVVGDVRHEGLDAEPRPELFFSHRQAGAGGMTYFVRTLGNPASTIESVQREIWAVEPLQAFYRVATMNELFSNTLKPRRFITMLLSGFAGMALLMASIGIYGVISFYVSSRTHELGVRMALGATRSEIIGSVVRHGLSLTGIGLVIGLAGAWFATRSISGFLYGVAPADVITFVSAGVVIVLVSVLASYIPARRVTQVDPVTALRSE